MELPRLTATCFSPRSPCTGPRTRSPPRCCPTGLITTIQVRPSRPTTPRRSRPRSRSSGANASRFRNPLASWPSATTTSRRGPSTQPAGTFPQSPNRTSWRASCARRSAQCATRPDPEPSPVEAALRQRVEDQVGARDLTRVRRGIGPLDLAVLDQHEAAVADARPVDVGAVGLRDLALGMKVGQQRHGQIELLAEGVMRIAGVDADADQRRALRLDLAEHLLVQVELIGADGAEVERIEDEHELAPGEVGKRDLVAVLVRQ